jgi:phosphoenolpyruvate carboxykinase (ATP)
MITAGVRPSLYGLQNQDIHYARNAYWNLGTAQLVEHSILRGEGTLASGGPLVVKTGEHTGRSPGDKFVVQDARTENTVAWGSVNQSITPAQFDSLYGRMMAYLQNRDLFVQDCYAGADPHYRVPIRVITEWAWHSLFARQLFIRPNPHTTDQHVPEFTIVDAPGFRATPENDGTISPVFVILNFTRRLVIIGGTGYAGEIKKAVFTLLNYLLPDKEVLPMHCSANLGEDGDVALFFGLSGTGKTTLSADPDRRLIGDDEHGWSPAGVFNFEGGCYAKCIRLSHQDEPEIWGAMRFGTVLENVAIDPDLRLLDYNDAAVTENTRAAYPLTFIGNAVTSGYADHPSNIVLLTCDAFGVLPPLARLSPEQAMFHFLNGYTAKVAGTEKGLGKEPQVTFSACFGAPFLPRPAKVYAELLAAKMRTHRVNCWLVNTGWSGGPYGIGQRMSLPVTRALVRAVLGGQLDAVRFRPHHAFHCSVPDTCPGVDDRVLDPRQTWMDRAAYDRAAQELARRFEKNAAQFQVAPVRATA